MGTCKQVESTHVDRLLGGCKSLAGSVAGLQGRSVIPEEDWNLAQHTLEHLISTVQLLC